MKNTKKALFASAVSLLLCVTMLVGSTFAWFTDTATTGVNKITAGNLDVAFEYSKDFAAWNDAEGATEIFDSNAKWEPGRAEVVYFKAINNGTLALEFKVATNVVLNTTGLNAKGEEIDLAALLQFGIVEVDAAFADRAAAIAAIETPNAFSNIATGEMVLETKGEEKTFAMVVWMPADIDNAANHNGINVPSIQFGVSILATQRNAEADSFGNDYDENATYPQGPKLDAIVAAPKTAAELANILTTALTGGSATGTITINLEDDFDLNNEWTSIQGSNYSGVNKVVINGNGHYIKNLNQPLLSKLFAGSEGSITFNNLTIKDSVITAAGADDEGIGVFVNTTDATNVVTFNNCHIDSVNITNTGAESYLAGFLGYSSSKTLVFKDCSVKNSEFTGMKDIGAFVGYTTATTTVTNPTITDNIITSSNASTYRVGAVAGTVNVNPMTITGADISGNTIAQASASTAKIHDYAGRIYASVFVEGVDVKPAA